MPCEAHSLSTLLLLTMAPRPASCCRWRLSSCFWSWTAALPPPPPLGRRARPPLLTPPPLLRLRPGPAPPATRSCCRSSTAAGSAARCGRPGGWRALQVQHIAPAILVPTTEGGVASPRLWLPGHGLLCGMPHTTPPLPADHLRPPASSAALDAACRLLPAGPGRRGTPWFSAWRAARPWWQPPHGPRRCWRPRAATRLSWCSVVCEWRRACPVCAWACCQGPSMRLRFLLTPKLGLLLPPLLPLPACAVGSWCQAFQQPAAPCRTG